MRQGVGVRVVCLVLCYCCLCSCALFSHQLRLSAGDRGSHLCIWMWVSCLYDQEQNLLAVNRWILQLCHVPSSSFFSPLDPSLALLFELSKDQILPPSPYNRVHRPTKTRAMSLPSSSTRLADDTAHASVQLRWHISHSLANK